MMVTLLLASEVLTEPGGKAQYATAAAFQLTVAVVIGFSVLASLCAFALPKGKTIQFRTAPRVPRAEQTIAEAAGDAR